MNQEKANHKDQKDTGYSKSQAPGISMPKGGGAMKGIDEKFNVNAVNGTSGMTIPIPSLKTRSNFAPGLTLSYNSGGGNSEFGLGWGLSLPSIQRKTDKRLPEYNDIVESDVFLFAGAEDLVPKNGGVSHVGNFTITRYIPRIEGMFARIEQIRPDGESYFYWKVTTKDNLTTFFGLNATSRLSDPDFEDARIYKWLPDFSFDDKGNYYVFEYKAENLDNVPKQVHEQHRHKGLQTFANIYLKKIRYGNDVPFYLTEANAYAPNIPITSCHFTTIFDYGEHNEDAPEISEANTWPCRKDPFSDYHAGFEIRTYRLCKRILCFSHFDELTGGTNLNTAILVSSVNLTYKFETTPFDLLETDYIIAATQRMYRKTDTGYVSKSLPTMLFTYQEVQWDTSIHNISKENLVHAPTGLSGGYQWMDFYGEGISGILTEQAEGWYYKSNWGDGTFSPAQKIAPKPNFTGLQLQDLEANGKKYAVSNNIGTQGYFELDDDDKWQNFRAFKHIPNIDYNDANTCMLDLNGDGMPDILITQERVFTYYESKGIEGYGQAKTTTHPLDENKGPSVVFADSKQSIFLADMSGDGMTDIVRIRNKDICYWPNLGYGKFGAKVTMSDAPLMDRPDQFNPAYIHLSDISGTGASDIIYLGKNKFKAWLNLSGNGWSEAQEINPFPHTEQPNTLSVIDLLGNGTSCLVWSSPLPQYSSSPMRYIDLMGGNKPYLMKQYDNSAGKITTLTYKSSTHYYLEDKKKGKQWITKLPFPVHCVESTEVKDVVTGNTYKNLYSYHHGYYDHAEREFRGFGRVEILDSETFVNPNEEGYLDEPPILTKTWYHTGAWMRDKKILEHYKHEYFNPALYNGNTFNEADLVQTALPNTWTAIEQREAYRALKSTALRQELYALDGSTKQHLPYSTTENNFDIQLLQAKSNNRFAVFLVHQSESIVYNYERDAHDPRVAHSLNIVIDQYANVLESASVVYGRKNTPATGIPALVKTEQEKLHVIYSYIDYTNDLITAPDYYRLRLPYQSKQYELTGCTPIGDYFTIDELKNHFTVATEIDYADTATTGEQKRCIEVQFSTFYDDTTNVELGYGVLESKAIPYQTYRAAFTTQLISDVYDTKADTGMIESEGFYIESGGIYWIMSGTVSYTQDGFTNPASPTTVIAKDNFFLPLMAIDPFGNNTYLQYYPDYHLLLQSTKDALGNVSTIEEFEWRTLQPQKMKDINDNRSVMAYDILGMPTGMALLGKGDYDFSTDTTSSSQADGLNGFNADLTDGELNDFFANPLDHAVDILANATARYVYDYESLPLRVASITREKHFYPPEEEGGANQKTPEIGKDGNSVYLAFEYSDGLGRLLMKKALAEPEAGSSVLRWIGSGRTILNNKSKPIKQYEPYFSATHACETDIDIIQVGYSPVIYYDPVGRVIRTDMPDGAYSKLVFDAWMQATYDANDTVEDSLWRKERLRPSGALSTIPEERDAAAKAMAHNNTPTVVHTDSLSRPFYTIQNNGKSIITDDNSTPNNDEDDIWTKTDLFYTSYVVLDIEGNTKEVHDANGNTQLQYKHDMLGNIIYQNSIDGGERWMLNDVFGKPVYGWDGMTPTQIAHNVYDELHRPIEGYIDGRQISKIEYGENEPDAILENFRGQAIRTWDSAGKQELTKINFKGQPLHNELTLIEDATITDIDWLQNPTLSTETFTTDIVYDALRPIKQTDPGGNVTENKYSEGGLLNKVKLNGNEYVTGIIHNAKGQREHIYYGNNTKTKYEYNPKNYRVTRILTTVNAGADILQDLLYTYDAVGNVTTLYNHALEPVYFNNQQIEPKQTFTYDALYRLIESTGRETFNGQDDYSQDQAFTPFSNAFDNANPNALTNYTQQYSYDAVGNITKLQHIAGSNSFTRDYSYIAGSNKLDRTDIANTATAYDYDAHGNLTQLNSLTAIQWNALDQLSYIEKTNTLNAYYQYSGGNRIRKTINKQTGEIEQRIYLGSFELYRKYNTGNSQPVLERSTVHIADDAGRIAMFEKLLQGNDGSEAELTRYIYSNHLQTASLELDSIGNVISYEEYHPYGTTSYHAKSNSINAVAKRYRYTGKERDEESGLYYHGARYYISWLCRWTAVDPLESKYAGMSGYNYCEGNPISHNDPDGRGKKKGQVASTPTPVATTIYQITVTDANATKSPSTNTSSLKGKHTETKPKSTATAKPKAKETSTKKQISTAPRPATTAPSNVDTAKFFDFMQYKCNDFLQYDNTGSVTLNNVDVFAQRTMNTIANGFLGTLDFIVNKSTFDKTMSDFYKWSTNGESLLLKSGNYTSKDLKKDLSNPDTYSTALGIGMSMKMIPFGKGGSPALGATGNTGIVLKSEMFGTELASEKLISSVSAKRDVLFAKKGSDAFKYMEGRIEGVAQGPTNSQILLMPSPSKITVLEEFLHGTQNRLGLIEGSSSINFAEWHAKDFMIRHSKLLQINEADVNILLQERDLYLKFLQQK